MISEEQVEELESLGYVYAEDELIVLQRDPVHIQVRVSSILESDHSPIKALLELTWGKNYPNEIPTIEIVSMDCSTTMKKDLKDKLVEVCESCMGMAMTYMLSTSLTSLLSEMHVDRLSKTKDDNATSAEVKDEEVLHNETACNGIQNGENKTKAQKRREQNNWAKAGELPRGYNWVDVVSHLRKTANSD